MQLQWLPISFRAQFKVLVMTCKALYLTGPGYFMDRLPLYMAARCRAFLVVALHPWNQLQGYLFYYLTSRDINLERISESDSCAAKL